MLSRRGLLVSSAAVASGCLTSGNTREASRAEVPTDSERHLAYTPDEYAANTANSPASKDSIPSIDDPEFSEAESGYAETLSDGEVVFGVEIDGDARAYPQEVMVHHEVVNDTVGGENVAVTYCPLTGTAMGYRRGGTTFGVDGVLVNSNLVLFDRATGTRYPQIVGTALEGSLKGEALDGFRVYWTTWGRWRERHPGTVVLTEDTGHVRNYDRDPYGSYSYGPHPDPAAGYYADDAVLYPVMNDDERFGPKEVFVCARDSQRAVAYRKGSLRDEGELAVETEGGVYTATYDEALDTANIEREGEPLVAFDAMWFAWAAFYPETEVRG